MSKLVERETSEARPPAGGRLVVRSLTAPLLVAVFCVPGAQSTSAQDTEGIIGGCDPIAVPIGQLVLATRTAAFEFGSDDIPPIPADFFNPGSEPFEGRVYWQAAPPTPNLTNGDMNIDRKQAAFIGPKGTMATVDIEIVEMNLVSVDPIVVQVGTESQLWDVQLTLPVGPQPLGEMTITHSIINGGVFSSTFPVCPEFTFVRIGDGETRTLTHCDESPPIQFSVSGAQWRFDLPVPEPVPSNCMYLASGHIVQWSSPDLKLPSTIDVVQAIGFVDCNQNLVNDTVDILDGSSFDTDASGIPDECECDGDVRGASPGAVDVTDLLALLAAWGPCPAPCLPACPADLNHDCAVDVTDLLALLAGWGPCPLP